MSTLVVYWRQIFHLCACVSRQGYVPSGDPGIRDRQILLLAGKGVGDVGYREGEGKGREGFTLIAYEATLGEASEEKKRN